MKQSPTKQLDSTMFIATLNYTLANEVERQEFWSILTQMLIRDQQNPTKQQKPN
jgi:hypothetical protein